MKNILRNCLKFIGVYAGYLALTVAVFYMTGLYSFKGAPTKLVLARMLLFPLFVSMATFIFVWLVRIAKKERD